jgi:hypothetical protein
MHVRGTISAARGRIGLVLALAATVFGIWLAVLGPRGASAANSCPTTSPYARAVSQTAGLAGFWRLGDASGTVACDGLGLSPGSYSGGTTLVQAGGLAGDSDTATSFDGTSGKVSVPAATQLDTGDTFTLEAWAKRGSTGGTANQTILSKQGTSWALVFTSANKLALTTSTKTIVSSTSTVADTTTWHHLVATKAGTTAKLFIDGVDVTGTVSKTTVANSTLPLTIGANGSATFFKGVLDEVAVYKSALSADQVTNHLLLGRVACAANSPYSNTISQAPGLLGYWRLGERSGTTA